MEATATVSTMMPDMMQKFVNHIIDAKKEGTWDDPSMSYTGICGWAGVMSPETRLACVKKFGEAVTAKAEAMAELVIAGRRHFWAESHAKVGQDEATAHEQTAGYIPQVGDYVWGYNSHLKADGGLLGAIDDMARNIDKYEATMSDMREFAHVEKVFHYASNTVEWTSPDHIVAADPQNFPGGVESQDVEDGKAYEDLCDEERNTFYTKVAAIVDESGRWYLVDAEGFGYARYILFPHDFENTFAAELAGQRKARQEREDAEARQEAQEKAERLADYQARCEKWAPLMQDVRPVIDAMKNQQYGTKEYRDLDRKLSTMRRANISAMIHEAFPGLKVSIRRNTGWGCAWDVNYTDGPTADEFSEKTDLGLFMQGYETFDGMTDCAGFEQMEFTDFAQKYMAIDYNGVEVHRNMSDEWQAEAVKKILAVAPNSSTYDAEGKGRSQNVITSLTMEQAQQLCKDFGVDTEKFDFVHSLESAELFARRIWEKTNFYVAPVKPEKKAQRKVVPVPTSGKDVKDGSYQLEPYSEKCYKLTGDTYDIREQLRAYGIWNRAHQCWFVSKKKVQQLADFLGITLA